jgi:hypothetical protein
MIEASKLVTVEVESHSQTSSLRLRRLHASYNVYAQYIDDLLPMCTIMQLLGMWSSVSYYD